MFAIIVLFLAGLFGFLLIAYHIGKNKKNESDRDYLLFFVLLAVVGAIAIACALWGIYTSGFGKLADPNISLTSLEVNEIYAAEGSIYLSPENEYVVVLRDREGDIRVYKFAEVPPPCFKVVENGNKKVFVAFP